MDSCDESDRQYKILLVEDDLVDVELVRRYLGQVRRPRFEVENAQYLQKGIELLTSDTIDAVLLDLNLPDSCGLDSVDLLKSVWDGGPIIVLTGVNEDCVGVDAVRHGAQDYLVKDGLSANLLSRAIRYAVQRHRLASCLDATKRSNEQFLAEFCEKLRDPLSQMLLAASDLCGNLESPQPEQDEQMERITACGIRMVELINRSSPRSATAEAV